MSTTVTRIYTFEAAHKLPDEFGGPASMLHGHSYTVRVTVEGGRRTEDLDERWSELALDHCLLNDVYQDTTVEGLAEAIFDYFAPFRPLAVEVQEGNQRFGRAAS